MKYTIILFKNKERKKILKSFKTLERAENFYKNLIKTSGEIVFNKRVENGKTSNFEIGLIDNSPMEFENYFVKDELGRQIKIQSDDNSRILKISKFNIEELIYDITNNSKISFQDFYKKYISSKTIKIVSKINNKFFVQDDEDVFLFSLKSESECFRFFDVFENYLKEKKKSNCILVSDSSIQQKKYLYTFLESKGISKKTLYKQSTTFFRE